MRLPQNTNLHPERGTAGTPCPTLLSRHLGATQGRAHRPGEPQRPLARSSGFTLIEMIVVAALIAVLLSVSVGMLAGMKEKARASVTRDTAKQIAESWTRHLQTLGEWPPEILARASETPSGFITTSPDHLMWLNKMDKAGNDGKPGLGYYFLEAKEKERAEGLKDSWGNLFHVWFDVDYDGQIRHPASPDDDPYYIKAAVVVFSKGADKDSPTKDDILVY